MLSGGAIALGDSRIENIEKQCAARENFGTDDPHPLSDAQPGGAGCAERGCELQHRAQGDRRALIRRATSRVRTTRSCLWSKWATCAKASCQATSRAPCAIRLRLPNIELRGIATNLACRSGVSPDAGNMAELSALADSIEAVFGLTLGTVSGGNSANLQWALGGEETGRVNDLRLGEALLLGCEPLHRHPIDGLHTDAITLVAEVIESKVKPSQPWGEIAQSAFGTVPPVAGHGVTEQVIFAVGRQDTDPDGLNAGDGIEILGASSDHLIADCGGRHLRVGSEITFQLNYSALMRAMTSPFVSKVTRDNCGDILPSAKLPATGVPHLSRRASPSLPEPQPAR